MVRPSAVAFAAALLLAPATAQAEPAGAAARLQAAIEELAAADARIPGVMAVVSAPAWDLEWSGATGVVAHGSSEPLRTTDAFRIASISKVFVAATTLRLIEQGRFGLHDSMSGLVSDRTRDRLRADGYAVEDITLFHLLTHTSGLYDLSSSESYAMAVATRPDHEWTRDEQIAFGMEHGSPVAAPGVAYNYSELSYIVLGEIIERETGLSIGDAVSRELQLRARGLRSTYWETLQDAPAGERRAHQYVGDIDLAAVNPSFDLHGGGGLVSTVGDLALFVRPLLKGEMFDHATTLAMALQTPPSENGRLSHTPLLAPLKVGKRYCWSHGGFSGSYMIYCPDIDVAATIAWNQAEVPDMWALVPSILGRAIEDIEQEAKAGDRRP